MSAPRILVVDHVSKVLGGAEVNLLELLAHPGARTGWDVTVGCAPESPLDKALAGAGIRRVPYGFAPSLNELRVVGRGFDPFAKLRALRELSRAAGRITELIGRHRPDLVLSPTNKDHFAAGAAARRAGIPSVWWVNDLLTRDFFGWPVRRAFVAKARKFATRLAPVSDAGRAALLAEGVPAGKIRTVHNGIPLERYLRDGTRPLRAELGLGPDEPMFGVVGRLTPWKGQDLFVRIAAGWHAAGRPGTFVIVGRAFNEDAPFEAALRARVAAAGLGSRVRFVPFRPGIAAALSSLDVLLHTSVKPEPFGRVIVEAMAVGTPVIAARAGGVPEIISDGEDGRLVAPGDEEEYLRGLADLQESPDLRARFAAAGRATVERRFGIGRVFRDFEELFSEARALGGE